MKQLRWVLGILFILFIVFFLSAKIYTDWMWFRSLGFQRLFITGWLYRVAAGAIFGLFAAVFLAGNVLLARRFSPNTRLILAEQRMEQFLSRARWHFDRYFATATVIGSVAVGVLAGMAMGSYWETWMRYFSSAPSGIKDPLFGLDISFYLFTMPALEIVQRYLIFIFAVAMILAGFVHLVRGTINPGSGLRSIYGRGAAHLAFLGALLMATVSSGWWLAAHNLLYSSRGAVYGAGYTDVKVLLPVYQGLFYLGLVTAALILVGGSTRRWSLPIAGLAVLGVVGVVGGLIVPAAVQQLWVSPNEIAREKPYIKKGIESTRRAFALNDVVRKPFPMVDKLTAKEINNNRGTIDNLRLWDWRPLKTTYSQIQEIRLYYKFNDVDLDRYVVDDRYRQIAVSAREMTTNELPESARTWINRHLIYTHGYGVVASPVNEVVGEGLPELIIKNIPPKSTTDLKVDKPEIYFGETTEDYAVVGTKTREFNYPSGDRNKYTKYKGSGGVELNSFLRRAAFAYRFGTVKLAISDAVTGKSRVLFYRDIKERLNMLTPFITYDQDPYMVIVDGRLYWMADGYTLSSRYPYSQPASGKMNYMRNSVKAVIDAYNGSVDFYISDKDDPIIKAYSKAYKGTFKPLSEMDPGLFKHIRYPEALFRVQAEVFASFHMTDPQVFYNKEDLWDIPKEVYREETQLMEPYYVIAQLPGEKKTEFALILPFTPTNKSNMIAWMAARSDPPHYGRLILYTFSKEELVYGPLQIEARLDQDPEISRQLSLWNQRGSQVIRGNLIVVPIENSILYVEPIYLQAEAGELPELKRVAAGYGDKVVMEPTLSEALRVLTGAEEPVEEPGAVREGTATPGAGLSSTERDDLIQEAADAFEKAEEAQKKGDWAEYGRQLDILKSALSDLQ